MRHLFIVPLALAVAVSCGGSTFDQADGGASAASGASGASGSTASGGSSGVGGKGGAGGSSGSGGGGGSAGVPGFCSLPAESGNCDAYMPSYFHDAATGLCMPFVYGGCGGNENRFSTIEACQAACHGGTPNFDECVSPSQCMLASTSCCGACGDADMRAFVAINVLHYSDYGLAQNCQVICEACPDIDELLLTSQYFAPTCRSGECTVVDIRESSVTQCSDASECSLRDGAACCQGCDAAGIVAVRNDSSLFDLVCGGGDVGCPACASQIPPDLKADCISGRCAVTRP